MEQSRCIGLCLYLPFPNLPFWACGMYFDCKVKWTWPVHILKYIHTNTQWMNMDDVFTEMFGTP